MLIPGTTGQLPEAGIRMSAMLDFGPGAGGLRATGVGRNRSLVSADGDSIRQAVLEQTTYNVVPTQPLPVVRPWEDGP